MTRVVTILLLMPVFLLLICNSSEGASEPNSAGAVPSVETIVNKANVVAYYQGDDGKAKVKMTITNKQGQKRNREFIILRKDVKDGGDQKYFVYFQKPADVRKMVYMVHKHADPNKDDDRWLYLPALSLVKRIAAGDKRTSFVGSDFLYEDVSGRSLEDDTHELIETTEKMFVIKNVPKKPDSVEFGYYNVSIDRKTYVPMKMEFFDKEGKLYRVIESKKVEKIQDFYTVVKSEVRDLKKESKTEMEFSDIQYNIKLKDIFEERYLHRPPREATR
ncbi:MAG: outer membrane lipoprotein-sorting protein [Phycisphaerae bacterium]|nr:outer membrane lipoprotein-sorting protein [Phycisphaerae bacterium]NIP55419.1 outer membrane lipoprotein-sorting protein [Phycisphaerae bacterium]NIS54090.1 outer membrane lipoprotein-sorting protein [Phycisphaerae bacterium]NIU11732.1 outer membrane lipoprotein-sorting protein [Phycisphaerae bacterium]NIU59547.1 outer membrane lipoprotein-sorting protein [Phycisphaerae bacterium]